MSGAEGVPTLATLPADELGLVISRLSSDIDEATSPSTALNLRQLVWLGCTCRALRDAVARAQLPVIWVQLGRLGLRVDGRVTLAGSGADQRADTHRAALLRAWLAANAARLQRSELRVGHIALATIEAAAEVKIWLGAVLSSVPGLVVTPQLRLRVADGADMATPMLRLLRSETRLRPLSLHLDLERSATRHSYFVALALALCTQITDLRLMEPLRSGLNTDFALGVLEVCIARMPPHTAGMPQLRRLEVPLLSGFMPTGRMPVPTQLTRLRLGWASPVHFESAPESFATQQMRQLRHLELSALNLGPRNNNAYGVLGLDSDSDDDDSPAFAQPSPATRALALALRGCTALTALQLSDVCSVVGPWGGPEVFEALAGMTQLLSLQLNAVEMDGACMTALSQTLPLLGSLERLELLHISMLDTRFSVTGSFNGCKSCGPYPWRAVAWHVDSAPAPLEADVLPFENCLFRALHDMAPLSKLSLTGPAFSLPERSLHELARALSPHSQTLRHLRLGQCQVSEEVAAVGGGDASEADRSEGGSLVFALAALALPQLRELCLPLLRFEAADVSALLDALPGAAGLSRLELNITDDASHWPLWRSLLEGVGRMPRSPYAQLHGERAVLVRVVRGKAPLEWDPSTRFARKMHRDSSMQRHILMQAAVAAWRRELGVDMAMVIDHGDARALRSADPRAGVVGRDDEDEPAGDDGEDAAAEGDAVEWAERDEFDGGDGAEGGGSEWDECEEAEQDAFDDADVGAWQSQDELDDDDGFE